MMRKMWVLWASSHTIWENKYSLLHFHLPTWEKLWAEELSLGTELWLPWGKYEMHKVKLSFLSFSIHVFSDFLFQWYAGTSLLESQTPKKVFLSMSCCQKSMFYGGTKVENSYSAILLKSFPCYPSFSLYPLLQPSLHLIDHFVCKISIYPVLVCKYFFLAFFSGCPIVYNTYF